MDQFLFSAFELHHIHDQPSLPVVDSALVADNPEMAKIMEMNKQADQTGQSDSSDNELVKELNHAFDNVENSVEDRKYKRRWPPRPYTPLPPRVDDDDEEDDDDDGETDQILQTFGSQDRQSSGQICDGQMEILQLPIPEPAPPIPQAGNLLFNTRKRKMGEEMLKNDDQEEDMDQD